LAARSLASTLEPNELYHFTDGKSTLSGHDRSAGSERQESQAVNCHNKKACEYDQPVFAAAESITTTLIIKRRWHIYPSV
jgi:hypothetical protein